MVAAPTSVEGVGETEVAVFRSGGWKSLPGFELIARAAEHDDAIDLLVFGEAGGGGGTVGSTGKNDLFPLEALAVGGEEKKAAKKAAPKAEEAAAE